MYQVYLPSKVNDSWKIRKFVRNNTLWVLLSKI